MTTVTVHEGEFGILWNEVHCILGYNVMSWRLDLLSTSRSYTMLWYSLSRAPLRELHSCSSTT